LKQKKLKELEEARKKAETATPVTEAQDADFTTKLVAKIIDNLQVQVGKIHIRFEDAASDPQNPFALGATLGGVSVLSTNRDWQPGFVHETTGVLHKVLTLNSLALYMHTATTPLGNLSQAEFLRVASSLVHDQSKTIPLDHQYLLKPLSGGVKLRVDLRPHAPMDSPKVRAEVAVEEIGFALDDTQYYTFFELIDIFADYAKKERVRSFLSWSYSFLLFSFLIFFFFFL